MSAYDEKPWLARYDAGVPVEVEPEYDTAVAMFRDSVAHAPDSPAICYFDATLSFADVDELSDALAAALQGYGVAKGDRVGIVLQNVPQFVVTTVAGWKAGAVIVPVNPMYRERELTEVLGDSGARVVVCLESTAGAVNRAAAATGVETVLTTTELEFQTRDDERVLGSTSRSPGLGTADLMEVIEQHRGQQPRAVALGPEDLAYLPYTSGTTGPPKGSMNTHANVVYTSQVYREWMRLDSDGAMFAVAPLFHITGLIGHLTAPILARCPTILTCRFHPVVAAEEIRDHGATAIIGAITVFIAWTNSAEVTREHLAGLRAVYSGGAPVPHAALEAFRDKFGHYVHNGYGLTESNSPAIVVPFGKEAPTDPASGAVSIGVPVSGTSASIVDDQDNPTPVGEIGEIVLVGPGIAAGYWNKPEETEHAMPGGRFHTGDVGVMGSEGWFFIVDRKKDQINAAGFKVWPREVEDVLYEHPAVREAAVVGVVDPYRGETVKAVISLKEGG